MVCVLIGVCTCAGLAAVVGWCVSVALRDMERVAVVVWRAAAPPATPPPPPSSLAVDEGAEAPMLLASRATPAASTQHRTTTKRGRRMGRPWKTTTSRPSQHVARSPRPPPPPGPVSPPPPHRSSRGSALPRHRMVAHLTESCPNTRGRCSGCHPRIPRFQIHRTIILKDERRNDGCCRRW